MYSLNSLIDYPRLIATAQTKILRHDRRTRKTQEQLDALILQIETAIAFDADLKNEQQRKAKKLELMQQENYQLLVRALEDATDRRTKLEIELNLLRNEFAVGKLIARDSIASKEAAA